jgi:hypothetical protein
LETGKLLLNLNLLPYSYFGGSANNRRPGTLIALADITGDGHPDLIWGAYVFKIHIENYSGTAGNTATLITKAGIDDLPAGTIPTQYTANANAGADYWQFPPAFPSMYSTTLTEANASNILYTIPIDFKGDGKPEVLVYSTSGTYPLPSNADPANAVGFMYIYDPITGEVLAHRTLTGNQVTQGSPFVGCIDGDGIPEIMVGQGLGAQYSETNIYAYNVDLTTGSITDK